MCVSLYLQYLNIKLNDITIPDPDKYPHMVSMFQYAVCTVCVV